MSSVDDEVNRDRTIPAAGSLGEAVNVFFDRAEASLPKFVGKKDAIIASLIGLLVVLVVSIPPINELRRTAQTPLEKVTWIGAAMLSLCLLYTSPSPRDRG